MKTIQFFNDHIVSSAQELVDETGKAKELTIRESNTIKNRIEGFKKAKAYMLTNPSEDFIRAEITRLEDFMSAKHLEFQEAWGDRLEKLPTPEVSKIRKSFEDQYQIPQKRKQLKFLRFLLD